MPLQSLLGGTNRLCGRLEGMETLVELQSRIFDLLEAGISQNDKEFKVLMNRLMSHVRMINPTMMATFSEWRSEVGSRRGLDQSMNT